MAEIATKFPPQTYCSSFYLNTLAEEDICVNDTTTQHVGKKRSRNKDTDDDDSTGPILDCFISAMLPSPMFFLHLLIFLIINPFSTNATPTSIECILPNHPQTRIFRDLPDYQHNTQSFQVHGAGYAGNNVAFSMATLDRVPKNAFISFTSQYVWQISLNGKQIREIDEGAFGGLYCLHVLDLGNNSLNVVSQGMWRGLAGLTTLRLDDNFIEGLGNLVFEELVGLRHLNLSQNSIKMIQIEAFESLYKLETLDLSGNDLVVILPETFTPLTSLTTLQLNSNRLQDLQPQLWKNLTKLTSLNLGDNLLTSFDPGYNFSFVSLKTLNLSINFLTKLNVHELRTHLPLLTNIDLNGNPWLCEDLASIVPALRDSRIVYTRTTNSLFGNVDGIPCNYNSAMYTERPTTEASTTIIIKPTANPRVVDDEEHVQNATLQMREELRKANETILNSMDKTQNLIVALIVLVVIFIAIEVAYRTDLINTVIRRMRQEHHYLQDDNADNIALLNT